MTQTALLEFKASCHLRQCHFDTDNRDAYVEHMAAVHGSRPKRGAPTRPWRPRRPSDSPDRRAEILDDYRVEWIDSTGNRRTGQKWSNAAGRNRIWVIPDEPDTDVVAWLLEHRPDGRCQPVDLWSSNNARDWSDAYANSWRQAGALMQGEAS